MDALQLEEAVRCLVELRELKATDAHMQYRLVVLERGLVSRLTASLTALITHTGFFDVPNPESETNGDDEEDAMYFLESEMASLLRSFKLLSLYQTVFDLISQLKLGPYIANHIIRQAFAAKSNIPYFMKGDGKAKLPLEVYLTSITRSIIQGSLRRLFALITDPSAYHHVAGYSVLQDCLFPLVLFTLD